MILLSLHCRNSEALRCSVLQTGSVVYVSLSITSFESVSTNQSSASKYWTHARTKCYRDLAGSLSPREPARRLRVMGCKHRIVSDI
jgi:hypothetical protein